MKAYLTFTPVGFMAFDEANILVAFKKFELTPNIIANKMLDLENGRKIIEAEEIISELTSNNYSTLICDTEHLYNFIKKIVVDKKLKITLEKNNSITRFFKADYDNILISYGGFKNKEEITELLNRVCLEYTSEKIKISSARRDMLVIQAIEALDDLDKNLNLNSSRLREWFSLHFPELNELVTSHQTYSKIISELGVKEDFDIQKLVELGLPDKRAELVVNSIPKSVGADLTTNDINIIKLYGEMIVKEFETRTRLEEYIDQTMEEVAPNIKYLAGSTLGARLISLAGGLENLAKMPASKIQIIGAEKALFTYLKSGDKPPKHGIIFQHPLIHNAPKWQRGKIARALAGKLAIAARLDYYSPKINPELSETLEKRVAEIKKKYKTPPEKPRKIKPSHKNKIKFSKKLQKRKSKGNK
ncbi:MAG: C/D box methylation guide ribonucleoprotein complex aNOP56 subunit [Candidatus Odinarchaeum yellowstonii]|uniref:C/D box methylation guide ribonucleoprotein complex aNOP56 subunit n=1 Tax=Odinarchaeota yellowstonii (strain LCB_4) TaxID=1841599 RepID=A0AAF0D0Z3_ODILC|nr:MAG: C/D box methylation guide ribonucleoprotein complex aNOP56 subunit [Candidatus Odinarchaeum yellowstonii]